MPTPVVFPSAKRAAGAGKETTPGTAVAAARWFPFTAFDPVEDPTPLKDQAMRGDMAATHGMVMGPQSTNGTFAGPGYMDTLGDWLYNILGGYAVGAPVSTVYPHTFSLLNSGSGQPPTHTLVDYHGMTASVGARVYPWACLSELTLSGNAAGLFQVTAKWSAFPSAAAGSTPTNAPTGETVIPAWRSTLSIAASAAVNLTDWSVTIARNLVVQHAADGTQAPYGIFRGEVTVTGKASFVAADESPLVTQFLANQQPALVLVVDNGGTLTGVRKATFTMTKGAYDSTIQKNDTLMGWDVTWEAIANATDVGASGGQGPITALVQNALTNY